MMINPLSSKETIYNTIFIKKKAESSVCTRQGQNLNKSTQHSSTKPISKSSDSPVRDDIFVAHSPSPEIISPVRDDIFVATPALP
jgi:hypothetical protein